MSRHPFRVARCAAAAGSLVALALSGAQARGAEPTVQSIKEGALRPGALPAWETQAEQQWTGPRPAPRRYPGPPMPLPPPPGFRVPAEFEPVAAFLVTQGDWWQAEVGMLTSMLKEGTVEQGAGAIVLTTDPVSSYEAYLEGQGIDLKRVRVLAPPDGLDAKWSRDFGPISILEQGLAGHLGFVDLHYYNKRPHDDAVAAFLAEQIGVKRFGLEGSDHAPADDAKLYLEGGNFQTDGKGTCIMSDDVPEDNAKAGNTLADTFDEVEQLLSGYLGCKKVIWLTPPPNTGTGHVDMYTKLLTPLDILVIDPPNQTNQDAEADAIIEQNVAKLEASTNVDGDPFVVHRIVIPTINSMWTYRTYTNSVIVNHVAMVPIYGKSADQAALAVYEKILGPTYKVVGIDSSSIVAQGGAVHCTTMQLASGCGNGTLDKLLFEECDGQDVDGATCVSLGLPQGLVTCDPGTCRLDTSGCVGLPEAGPEPVAEASIDSGVQEAAGLDATAEAEAGLALDGSPAIMPTEIAEDDGSCGCRTAGSRGARGWWLGAAALMGWLRRRRRHRACDRVS